MKKIAFISFIASSVLMAGGYKIPETSTNAVALGAANVAHNQNSADAAYYNPAKMVFMSDENHVDADLTYIGLEKVKFNGTVYGTGPYDIESENEDFFVPTLHYVSGALGDNGARIGLSIVSPGGLSKRWEDSIASYSAKEFTLKTIEVNPTAAFKVTDNMAFAAGIRFVRSSGVVTAVGVSPVIGSYYQDMTGTSVDVGFNLALEYNPLKELEIGATYRSKVNLTLKGDADLYSSTYGINGNYAASVTVPLPAAVNLAVAYTFPTKTTFEFVYEKTYWSSYNSLDFQYTDPTAEAVFGVSKDKNWKDTNTFRFGITQNLNDLTLMAGLVIDESPVPSQTIGFELPDTDSTSVSLGGRYKINKQLDIGLSALYSMHEDRTISATDANENGIVGEFSDGNILIISAGLGYKF